MRPVVAEIEHIEKLLTRLEPTELGPTIILNVTELLPIFVGRRQSHVVGQVELVEMGTVPAREGIIDRASQLGERVAPSSDEDPTRPRPEALAVTSTRSTRIDSHVRAINRCPSYSRFYRRPARPDRRGSTNLS
jgi:hypothetical protein